MKLHVYLLAVMPLALGGCVVHETTVPETTTVTHQVTTTGPSREIYVARTPPAVRVESQTISPGATSSETPRKAVRRP